jgi:hypothetical protein
MFLHSLCLYLFLLHKISNVPYKEEAMSLSMNHKKDKKAELMDQLPALSISSSEEAETSGNDANLVSPA